MKHNVIYIDNQNREQIHWWNRVASRLVTTVSKQVFYDSQTFQPTGTIVFIKGILANYVAKKNATFYPNR